MRVPHASLETCPANLSSVKIMPVDDAFGARADAPSPLGNSNVTLLLVDDEEELRAMCRRALEDDGAMVIEASDGVEALTLVQESTAPLDLVITDLKMPRLGGLEVAELLSIFRPELPVLAMTGDPGMADRRLPTLLKPFSLEELTDAARLMRGRAIAMRGWAQEKRARARQARQLAALMKTQTAALRNRVDLVAVALELKRLNSVAASSRQSADATALQPGNQSSRPLPRWAAPPAVDPNVGFVD
jgi:CheY-like chemotaxis protein